MSDPNLPFIPGYTLTAQLYAGSRTVVYRAISDSRGNRGGSVVIKGVRSQSPDALIRLRHHYIIAKNLRIPGIVTPLALVPWHHSNALVMEDVGGIALRDYLQTHGRLAVQQVLAIALQLADSLHHLSQQRVLHRDINPANILLHPDTHQIWLTDFSLASLLPQECRELQSSGALEGGTLAYIAPEQTGRMNRGMDSRADFYSLGVTLYELLTGHCPFQSDDPMELIHSHIAKAPVPPWEAWERGEEKLPKPLSDVVLKLMAKNPENRYQSALGLKHDLQQCWDQWQASGQVEAFELGQWDVCDRFLIPTKLYGREAEVKTLMDAFARVSQGASELMLMAGFSGTGKTSVVNEVHKAISRQKGYFIEGKFDQFNRNIPFFAFVQAFRSLMGQLLGESDGALATWKVKILHAIGDNGQVLIEVIPELERIIGQQSAVPELSGSAAQNRFNRLFGQFIRVFTSPDQPLVIFLDDLQWIDSASLNLFKLLMDDESAYLLVLGAYRDNEVWSAHPLMLMFDEIRQLGVTLHTLTLKPLKENDIEHLVADTLHYSTELARPLAQLVYQKTQGNPFFATQFLQGLYGDGLILFNGEAGYWQYNWLQVRQLALSDDVMAFMVERLRQLPTATQEVLKLSACIGNHFDLPTLAVVCESAQADVAANLWPLLQMGLVVPDSHADKILPSELETLESTDALLTDGMGISYRFLHDYVQQSAHALIPQDQKRQVHYHLGQLLAREISAASQETRIFELVTHLNHGADYITVQSFRDDVARLNLQACQKAKRAIAYQSGDEYATMGLAWLGAGAWERQYDLSLQLHNLAAEFAWFCGDLETMGRHIQTILNQAQSLLDKIPAFCLRIQADTSQMQFAEALTTAQHVFESLGVVLPSTATLADGPALVADVPALADVPTLVADVPTLVAGVEQLLAETTIADLGNLPGMDQQSDVAVIRIISQVIPAAYICGSPLFPIVVILGVKLLIRAGNSPLSAYIYANYAYILCNYCQAIETSEKFGQLALELANAPDAKSVRPQVYVMLALYMQHRKSPLRETLDLAQQGYIFAQEVGNQEWAGYSAYAFCANGFAAAHNLIDLAKLTQNYCVSLMKLSQIAPANWCQIYRQAILSLTNPSPQNQRIFFGNPGQEAEFLAGLHEAKDLLGLYHFHLCKLIISYLFGDIETAHLHASEARTRLDVAQGTVGLPVFYFYDSLVVLSQLTQLTIDSEAGGRALHHVEENQDKLQQDWAHYAPMNYQHKFELVQAEKLSILGERWAAMDLYDSAIADAKAHGYLQEEALANELAAKRYLSWGKQKIAAVYMQDAYHCYGRWGAKVKTDDLAQRYPDLLQSLLNKLPGANPLDALASVTNAHLSGNASPETFPSSGSNAYLDFSTVLNSAQLLSEKIQLDELLTQLVKLMLQNSGADRLAIVLPEKDGLWQVRATATPETTTLLAQPLTHYANLPIQLIQYVKNTQEVIVIDGLDTTLPIVDRYLQQHQPQSVLCLPFLYQGDLSGLMYLQNQSVSGVFSRDRILVLNFLCTQAAIALENARLFKEQQQSAIDLQIKNSFLKAQQESSLDGMLVIDENRQVVAYNQRFVSIWNIPETVLATKDDRQLLDYVLVQLENPTEFLDKVEALYGHPEESSHDEINLVDQRVLERYSSSVRLPSGEYSSRIWYFRDISDRKRKEKSLRLTQFAVDKTAMGIFWVGEDALILDVNEAACADLGYSRNELKGQYVWDVNPGLHPNEWPGHWEDLKQKHALKLEVHHRHKNGKILPVEIIANYFEYEGQGFSFAQAQDISDRKQTERLLTDYNRELEHQVQERTQALQASEERLRLALSATNQGFIDMNLETGEVIVSPEYALMLGYDPATFHETETTWWSRVHPDDYERARQAYRDYESGQTTQYTVEFRLQTRQRDWKWILSMGKFTEWDGTGRPIRLLGTHTDISDRKFAEIQLAAQNELLARIAQGQPLLEVLNALIYHVERSLDGVLCSVLFLDKGNRLCHGAAPSLPAAYNQAIDGVLIGEGVGSCGNAAFRNQTVIVADIATDPLWATYKDLALENGLKACWSNPINASSGEVLGTLAMYYQQVRSPHPHELKVITQMAHIAGIAIERQQAEAQLRQSEATLLRAQQVAHVGNWEFDIASETITWSPEMFRIYGLDPAASAPSYADYLQMLPDETRLQLQKYVDRAIAEGTPYTIEYSRTKADGTLSHHRCRAEVEHDAHGQALRLFGTNLDITDFKQTELALQNLVAGTAALTGPDFFPALAQHIATALNASHAFVTEIVEGNQLRYLAAWGDGQHLPTDIVDVEGTTCAVTIRDGTYHCEQDVIACFPHNPRLAPMEVESYMGVALQNRQGQALGTLCIFSRQSIANPEHSQKILRVFAARAAAELERQRAEQAMDQLNRELEMRVRDRTAQLAASERRLQTLFNEAADAVFLKNEDKIIDCNQAAVDLLRYSHKDELLTLQTNQISPERQPDGQLSVVKAQAMCQEALQRGSLRFEWMHQRADGEKFWAEITLTSIRYQAETILHCIVRDISDRKQLEQEQAQLIAVLEATPDFIGIANAQGEILWHNKPLRELREDLGVSQGHRSIEHCHPDWVNKIIRNQALPAAIQHGSWSGELALLDGAGNEIPVSQVIIAHKSASGEVENFSTVMRDIRTIKQTEAALKLSKARAQATFSQAAVGFVEVDIKTKKCVRFNNCFSDMLGYANNELAEMTVREITHPDDVSASVDVMTRLHKGDVDNFTLEKRYIRKDGSTFWAETTCYMIKPHGVEATHSVGLVQDISEKKRLEAERQRATFALQLSEARATAAFEQAAVGIAESNLADGKITRTNNYFCQMTGYTVQELESMTGADLTHPDDISASRHKVKQLYTGKIDSFTIEKRYLRKDGSCFWATTAVTLIQNPEEDSSRCLAVIQDISDRKQAEVQLHRTNAELVRATRLKDEFLANMSHELRTPLNSILGLSEALQDEVFGPLTQSQLKYLKTIERSGTHLLDLINDILDVAKIEAGQFEIDVSATDIASLCESSLTLVQQQAIKKHISLTTAIPPLAPTLSIDGRRILQSLVNLLNNAVKFTPEGGSVALEVSYRQQDKTETAVDTQTIFESDQNPKKWGWKSGPLRAKNYIQLSVTDTGIGIAPEHITKLFKPFSQIDSTLNRKYMGTGLGLVLVKQMAELHGGTVSLTSEVGVGSCFCINLPYEPDVSQIEADPLSDEINSPSLPAPPDESPLILLAEDNEDTISLMVSYLETVGYRLMVANDGLETLKLAQSHHPDLILMDIQMPELDGIESMQRLRQSPQLRQVPIIALTALAMAGDKERCLEAGANEYLSKPVKLKQLVRSIQTLLGQ